MTAINMCSNVPMNFELLVNESWSGQILASPTVCYSLHTHMRVHAHVNSHLM